MKLVQDITVTLDLSEMSPEKYQKTIRELKSLSIEPVEISTYDPKNPNMLLTKEHLDYLESLQ